MCSIFCSSSIHFPLASVCINIYGNHLAVKCTQMDQQRSTVEVYIGLITKFACFSAFLGTEQLAKA